MTTLASEYCLLILAEHSTQSPLMTLVEKTKHSGVKYHTLQLDIGLPLKHTTDCLDDVPSTPMLNNRVPLGFCLTDPFCSCSLAVIAYPRRGENSTVKFVDDTAIIGKP